MSNNVGGTLRIILTHIKYIYMCIYMKDDLPVSEEDLEAVGEQVRVELLHLGPQGRQPLPDWPKTQPE